jgi:xylitol oxidase
MLESILWPDGPVCPKCGCVGRSRRLGGTSSRMGSNFDAVMSGGYSVSLMTIWSAPTVTGLWIKTRLVGGWPETISAAHLGAAPAIRATVNTAPEAMQRLTAFGPPGPWSERLPHFRADEEPALAAHVQSEYMVPRTRAVEALTMLRKIGDRIDRHLLATEIRSMAADALWLSPSYGHDSIGIHFSWNGTPDDVHRITAQMEEMLLPLGARPHWGKIMHAPAEQLASLYSKLSEFRALPAAMTRAGRSAMISGHARVRWGVGPRCRDAV